MCFVSQFPLELFNRIGESVSIVTVLKKGSFVWEEPGHRETTCIRTTSNKKGFNLYIDKINCS